MEDHDTARSGDRRGRDAALVARAAAPAAAQSRREMQMMADIRMLQEQTQQLQQQLAAALAQSARPSSSCRPAQDDQNAATRKGFADQKLTIDQVGSDLRIVKERVDETNVRITSLSQEVEALRVATLPSTPAPPTDSALDPAAGSDPCAPATQPPSGAAPTPSTAGGPPPAAHPTAHQSGHLSAAAVRHRVDRLHRRPVDAVHRGLQHLPAQLPAQRGRRRCPVLYRRVQLRRRQVHRGDGCLQPRDRQLPARRQGCPMRTTSAA